jgi:hypothetical protein
MSSWFSLWPQTPDVNKRKRIVKKMLWNFM